MGLWRQFEGRGILGDLKGLYEDVLKFIWAVKGVYKFKQKREFERKMSGDLLYEFKDEFIDDLKEISEEWFTGV